MVGTRAWVFVSSQLSCEYMAARQMVRTKTGSCSNLPHGFYKQRGLSKVVANAHGTVLPMPTADAPRRARPALGPPAGAPRGGPPRACHGRGAAAPGLPRATSGRPREAAGATTPNRVRPFERDPRSLSRQPWGRGRAGAFLTKLASTPAIETRRQPSEQRHSPARERNGPGRGTCGWRPRSGRRRRRVEVLAASHLTDHTRPCCYCHCHCSTTTEL